MSEDFPFWPTQPDQYQDVTTNPPVPPAYAPGGVRQPQGPRAAFDRVMTPLWAIDEERAAAANAQTIPTAYGLGHHDLPPERDDSHLYDDDSVVYDSTETTQIPVAAPLDHRYSHHDMQTQADTRTPASLYVEAEPGLDELMGEYDRQMGQQHRVDYPAAGAPPKHDDHSYDPNAY